MSARSLSATERSPLEVQVELILSGYRSPKWGDPGSSCIAPSPYQGWGAYKRRKFFNDFKDIIVEAHCAAKHNNSTINLPPRRSVKATGKSWSKTNKGYLTSMHHEGRQGWASLETTTFPPLRQPRRANGPYQNAGRYTTILRTESNR